MVHARNGHSRLVGPDGRPFRLGYDAVEDKKRRRPPRVRLASEDAELRAADRRKLVSTSRDLPRNFAIAAWLCRMHVANVADFAFQARTGDAGLDARLEELVAWWSRPANFDVAGRHGLDRFIRLAEIRRLIDGDFFVLKLSSGRVQGIEGDRIRNPVGAPANLDIEKLVHGVQLSPAGAPRGYCLHNRRPSGDGFEFARLVPARHMLAHGYFDRIDQVRGISPFSAAVATLQDIYEVANYAVLKAKVSQIFGVLMKRSDEDPEAFGDVTATTDADGAIDKSATTVDLGRGPFVTDVGPDDSVQIVESSQPSHQLQDFLRLAVMIALKAVDLPYSWFDQKGASWSANRAEWVLYNQVSRAKRADNRELLNALLAWRIGLWVLDGVLELPSTASIDDLRWEWVPKRLGWVDPQKEAAGWKIALEQQLTSRQRICAERGEDFWEIADELAAEAEYLGGSPAVPPPARQRRRGQSVASLKDYRHALPFAA